MTKLLATLAIATSTLAAAEFSRVYVYDLSPAVGSNPVWVDGAKTAQLRGNRFFGLNLPRGRHSFSGTGSSKIILEVEPGKTYYLRLDQVFPYPGGPPSQPADWYDRLTPQRAEDAGKVFNQLLPIEDRDIFDREHVTLARPEEPRP